MTTDTGWHPEVAGLKRRIERGLFKLTGGYRLKDAAESLVANPATRKIVAPLIRSYVLEPLKRRSLIFIHIPKNAGTSISTAIYGRGLAHYRASFYRQLDPAFYDSLPSFAILRDPIDRFLSAYFFVKNGGGDMIDLYPSWIKIYDRNGIDNLNIDEFIALHQSMTQRYRRLDYVLRPQHEFVVNDDGHVIVDHLFIMGRHDEALKGFLDSHGIEHVPRLNTTARRSITLSYDQVDAIRDLYRLDFELLYDAQ